VTTVLFAVLNLVLIIPAIILHEVSHGYVALLLGDTTARDAGRLTLNPIAHVDPFGTIVLPLLMLLVSGGHFAFGYARPVPIDPRRMTRVGYRNGMLLTGAAGPAMNIVLAMIAAVALRMLGILGTPDTSIAMYICAFFMLFNLLLAFFNLIPIPPLDGSRVVQRFLSGHALEAYSSIERYGFFILVLLIFLLPMVNANLDIISWILNYVVVPVGAFLGGPHFIGVLTHFLA
jgi:Zn-dependent protease